MNESKARFGIAIDKIGTDQWSFGMCFSHLFDETYLLINLFKWSISIGWLVKEWYHHDLP